VLVGIFINIDFFYKLSLVRFSFSGFAGTTMKGGVYGERKDDE